MRVYSISPSQKFPMTWILASGLLNYHTPISILVQRETWQWQSRNEIQVCAKRIHPKTTTPSYITGQIPLHITIG